MNLLGVQDPSLASNNLQTRAATHCTRALSRSRTVARKLREHKTNHPLANRRAVLQCHGSSLELVEKPYQAEDRGQSRILLCLQIVQRHDQPAPAMLLVTCVHPPDHSRLPWDGAEWEWKQLCGSMLPAYVSVSYGIQSSLQICPKRRLLDRKRRRNLCCSVRVVSRVTAIVMQRVAREPTGWSSCLM